MNKKKITRDSNKGKNKKFLYNNYMILKFPSVQVHVIIIKSKGMVLPWLGTSEDLISPGLLSPKKINVVSFLYIMK